MTTGLRLGIAVPMFASPGLLELRTPSLERVDWAETRDAVLLAEELGYDSAWFSDHLYLGPDGAFLDNWSTLSALAALTSRIRLVTNHLNNYFRPPQLVAKAAGTVDAISGGRLEMLLAAGFREREPVSYGFGWDPEYDTRVRRLGEAITLMRRLWTEDSVDHDGEFFSVTGAHAAPRPVHPVAVSVGGPLTEESLRLIAAEADGWNAFPSSLEAYRQQAEQVDAACRAAGRDPRTLTRSLETQVLVLEDGGEWDSWLARWAELRAAHPERPWISDMLPDGLPDPAEAAERARRDFLIGTADEVRDRLEGYRALGVSEVACWFMDFPSTRSMRALAELRTD